MKRYSEFSHIIFLTNHSVTKKAISQYYMTKLQNIILLETHSFEEIQIKHISFIGRIYFPMQ